MAAIRRKIKTRFSFPDREKAGDGQAVTIGCFDRNKGTERERERGGVREGRREREGERERKSVI